jgi:hypothetical protein
MENSLPDKTNPWENNPDFDREFQEYSEKREGNFFWLTDKQLAYKNNTLPLKEKFSKEFDKYMTVPDDVKWKDIVMWFKPFYVEERYQYMPQVFRNKFDVAREIDAETSPVFEAREIDAKMSQEKSLEKPRKDRLRKSINKLSKFEISQAKEIFLKQKTIGKEKDLLPVYSNIEASIVGSDNGFHDTITDDKRQRINKEFFYTYVYLPKKQENAKPWEKDLEFDREFQEYSEKRKGKLRDLAFDIAFWKSDKLLAFEDNTLPEKKEFSRIFDEYMTVPNDKKWVDIKTWFDSLKDNRYEHMPNKFKNLSLPTTAILKTKHQQLRDELDIIKDSIPYAKQIYVEQNSISADLVLKEKYQEIYDKIMGLDEEGLPNFETPSEQQLEQIKKKFFYYYVYLPKKQQSQQGGKSKKTRRARRKVRKTRRLRHH